MDDLQQHVMTVFGEALDCASPEARAAYLDGACQKSPEMRRRVEKLLAAHEQAGHFLDGPAAPNRPCPTADWPLGEGPGTAVGPYKLLERIGEGGFGVVFMAEQQQPVRRKVALKLIKPGMDSRQVIARFEAERQALALMEHPNIARVLDAGTTPSGRPYFVMELVKGISITQYCDQNSLAPRQRLELFVAVCQAVQHAHHKGIIHRDIKPSNVLVTLHDGTPLVKVIDFGIAKATGQQLTEKLLVTNFAQMIGTPMYMSPEQAPLSGLDIDTRTDIYSLGVLLYELLTGTTPFDKERFREASYDELRRILREEEPPRPSTRLSTLGEEATSISARRQCEPRQLRRMFRGELDWIVMKALEKDRTRRYETASAFAADVQHYLDDEPVSACPPSAWYRLSKSMRRHKAALAAASAVALALLLAGVGGIWVMWDRAERRAELTQRKADTERAVQVALVKAEQLRVRAGEMPKGTSKEAEALLGIWAQAEAALGQAEAALNTGTADAALQLRVFEVKKQHERERDQAELRYQHLQRKEKLLADLDEARLTRSTWLSKSFDYAGASARYASAFAVYGLDASPSGLIELSTRIRAEEPAVREALIVALDDWANSAALAKTDWSASDLRALAGSVDDDPWRQRFRDAARFKDREALTTLSTEARQQSLPPSSFPLLAEILHYAHGERAEALALLRWARNRYPSDFWIALELAMVLERSTEHIALEYEEAIGSYRVALALRPNTFAAWINLGNLLRSQNHLDEALEACLKAIEINPNHPYAYTGLGNTLLAKKHLVEAVAAYHKAIEIDPRHAAAHINLGIALQGQNRLDEAVAAYRTAIDIDPRNAAAHINLGNVLQGQNRLDEAVAAYRTAIDINPKEARAFFGLGRTLHTKSQLDEAIEAYRNAIDIDLKFGAAYYRLGNVLSDKKQIDEAIAAYKRAIDNDSKHADVYVVLGNALMAKNQVDEAIAAYKKAIDIEPQSAMAYYNLGSALQAKKQEDEAIAAYRKAIEIEPKHASALTNLGNILRTKNQPDEAIVVYRKALEIDPKNAQTYLNLGGALQSKNQLNDAIAAYQKAIDINPRYAQAHHNLGVALRANKQVDEAIASYQKAIEINPKYALAYFNLGNALQSKNRHDEAISAYRQSIAADPKYGPVHFNLGNALRTKNLQDEAIAAYQKAIEINPKHMQAYNSLGLALADTKQLDAAIAAFRKAIDLDPKVAQTHYNLGKAILQRGDFTQAKALTRQALGLLPEKHALRPDALNQLQQCDRLLAVETQLPDLLAVKAKIADKRDRFDLIDVCRFQGRYVAASRLWAEVFAEDTKTADNPAATHRFDAACCAVLAAAGKGKDGGELDDGERRKLRQQALAWLRADLDQWRQRLEGGGAEDRPAVENKLQQWLRDSDLISVRGPQALETLQAEERGEWRTVWVEVAELLKRAGNPK